MSAASQLPVVVEAAHGAPEIGVVSAVRAWTKRDLPAQPLDALFARLLERPLRTSAFSGAVVVGERTILVHDGRFLGAVDGRSRASGDRALAGLPARAPVELYAPPEELGDDIVPLLADLARPGAPNLVTPIDDGILSPIEFAFQLAAGRFTGTLRAIGRGREAHLLLSAGRPLVALLVGAWPEMRGGGSWPTWMLQDAMQLELLEHRPAALAATFRILHRDLELSCSTEPPSPDKSSSSFALRRLSRLANRTGRPGRRVWLEPTAQRGPSPDLDADPAVAALRWLLGEAPPLFEEASLKKRWKYLAQWIPEVETARLHAELAHADGSRGSRFDVTTLDGAGKVLHLVRLVHGSGAEELSSAIDDAVAVKTALLESGDVGALVCVADRFSDEAVRSYLGRLDSASQGFARVQDSLTGNSGFLRVGPEHGFHVLLVERKGEALEAMMS